MQQTNTNVSQPSNISLKLVPVKVEGEEWEADWLKGNRGVPADPQSNWSVKLLPSAPTPSCQLPSSPSPFSSFSVCSVHPSLLLFQSPPRTLTVFAPHLQSPLSSICLFFFNPYCSSLTFTLSHDPAIGSSRPSSITLSLLLGHMSPISLLAAFCLHTVMIQRTWDHPRERRGSERQRIKEGAERARETEMERGRGEGRPDR